MSRLDDDAERLFNLLDGSRNIMFRRRECAALLGITLGRLTTVVRAAARVAASRDLILTVANPWEDDITSMMVTDDPMQAMNSALVLGKVAGGIEARKVLVEDTMRALAPTPGTPAAYYLLHVEQERLYAAASRASMEAFRDHEIARIKAEKAAKTP